MRQLVAVRHFTHHWRSFDDAWLFGLLIHLLSRITLRLLHGSSLGRGSADEFTLVVVDAEQLATSLLQDAVTVRVGHRFTVGQRFFGEGIGLEVLHCPLIGRAFFKGEAFTGVNQLGKAFGTVTLESVLGLADDFSRDVEQSLVVA